jgi:hypothetical protein
MRNSRRDIVSIVSPLTVPAKQYPRALAYALA